ncbi:DUF3047 family protein [Geothermobacter ehrlichii]|uniref:DUF3047 family protein n=1 Tax=Geothermobacter ehrlichii TaxID=213224 RepID=A0A5D3WH10_9BACT|nr:DUF3047 domain-containing protein [Geothermobacter ehrlichii]TYO96366.1 DUF3047 family protein [Geothermobacter ehrlichii]
MFWVRCVACLPLLLLLGAAPAAMTIDDFDNGLAACWQQKVFRGKTDYRIESDPSGGGWLRSEAAGTASALACKISFRPADWPVLSWRWKIDHVHPKGDARIRAGDDYPARVYVVFPHWFVPKTRALNYVWANRLPRGSFVPSPYTGNSVMIAVESGNDRAGQWIAERRNLLEDYRRAFGEDPPEAGAVAVMTDGDDTGGRVTAWYDAIRLLRD